jgi:hypothetical protein
MSRDVSCSVSRNARPTRTGLISGCCGSRRRRVLTEVQSRSATVSSVKSCGTIIRACGRSCGVALHSAQHRPSPLAKFLEIGSPALGGISDSVKGRARQPLTDAGREV